MIRKQDLIRGKSKIGVWGAGFIGGTTAMAYASEGVEVICYDINEKAVSDINIGKLGVTNLEFWFGASMEEFVKKGLVRATTDWEELKDNDVVVHFIAVPTEKDNAPWDDALLDVLAKLKEIKPPLIIIESTLTPNKLDEVEVGELNIGVAPRRDWFHSPEKNLKNLPRVYGAKNKEIAGDILEVLSIVCDHLLRASDHRVAELVKSVENSLLHVPAVYATQLARAYPDLNIDEVLNLAATHWRIPNYYPSFGTGGYCIPLSSQYVIRGAKYPEHLSILHAACEFDQNAPYFIANRIIEKVKGKVGILGVSYKGDLKVHTLSPAIPIIKSLKDAEDIEVFVNDPYYIPDEIKELFGVEWFDYQDDLSMFDALVIVTDHKVYSRYHLSKLLKELRSGILIMDNYGIWKKFAKFFKEKGIEYHKVGDMGWTLEEL